MIVPAFWAEARRQHRSTVPRRQVTVRRFGWSDTSLDDAQRHADARADDALARLLAGEDVYSREPKVPYNGADGVPIREEILAREGTCVVTRNSYGARCLNTPDVLFADVDFDTPAPGAWELRGIVWALAVAGGGFFEAWGWAALAAAVGTVVAQPVANAARGAWQALRGGRVASALARVEAFVRRHPHWHVRAYRTPAGLRAMAVHAPLDPNGPDAQAFFKALGADPLYVRMCERQRCFRARLTAKPWRAGLGDHLKPRPGTWPVAPERQAEREAWVARYEVVAAGFSACHFLGAFGDTQALHPTAAVALALHDAESRATQSLPLA